LFSECVCVLSNIFGYIPQIQLSQNRKKECNNLWLIEFYVYFILVFDQRNNNSEQRVEREIERGFFFWPKANPS